MSKPFIIAVPKSKNARSCKGFDHNSISHLNRSKNFYSDAFQISKSTLLIQHQFKTGIVDQKTSRVIYKDAVRYICIDTDCLNTIAGFKEHGRVILCEGFDRLLAIQTSSNAKRLWALKQAFPRATGSITFPSWVGRLKDL